MKIGVLTSGGDSPGMNAAIRAVVRAAISKDIGVIGYYRGYTGILKQEFIEMEASSVANIIQRGGTILRSDRCKEFFDASYRKKAAELLEANGVEGLVVIGGDGSYTGAHLLEKETGIPVIGLPGTIDNDVNGTEYTIGFDTAVNTAVYCIDNIRDTAGSHDRTFLVEVMGRESPAIACEVAVAVGAEVIVYPDQEQPEEMINASIQRGLMRNKKSSIIIVAEGKHPGRTYQIPEGLKAKYKVDSRVCILGHILRGGSPTARDRVAASQMGLYAVELLLKKKSHVMVSLVDGKMVDVPIDRCLVKRSYHDHSVGDQLAQLAT